MNLEDVMTNLDVSLAEPAATPESRAKLRLAQLELTDLINERLKVDPSGEACHLHVALASHAMAERATILSLNYDLILDHAVVKANDSRKIDFLRHALNLIENEDTNEELGGLGKFIKLHGALNWWRCSNLDCSRRERIYLSPFSFLSLSFVPEPFDPRCRICGHVREIAIVPPTMKGVFQSIGRLGYLWGIAVDDLRQADEVIVIGVSFPQSDYVLRWMVREATAARMLALTVVDIRREAAQTARAAFNATSATWFPSLQDFLDGTHPEIVTSSVATR